MTNQSDIQLEIAQMIQQFPCTSLKGYYLEKVSFIILHTEAADLRWTSSQRIKKMRVKRKYVPNKIMLPSSGIYTRGEGPRVLEMPRS